LKESGVTAKQFSDAIQKSTKASSEGFKSLRQQIKEAKEEAQKLAQEFGDTSSQAVNAQKKVAGLSDELADFNARVQALNPEAKFKAFSQVAQGGIGALQGLTGAMQIFGSENEDVNKIVQKFQGFINVTQGIESIAGLSDTFKNLGAVLGITTTAQNALKTSTIAGAVATEGATAANYAFAASLSATGIGAIVVAIGLLIGAWVAYTNSQDEATEAAERFNKSQKVFQSELEKNINSQKEKSSDLTEHKIRLLEIEGGKEKEILALKKRQIEYEIQYNDNVINNFKTSQELKAKLIEENKKLNFTLIEYNAELSKTPAIAKKASIDEVKALEERNKAWQDLYTNQQSLKKQFDDEMAKNPMQTVNAEGFKQSEEDSKKYWEGVKERLREGQAAYESFESERRQDIKETVAITLQGASETASSLNALNQQEAENRIASLDAQLNAGLISEQEYAKKVSQIKRKQAEQDKKTALFNAAILIAQAILAANALGPPQSIPAIAFASALGAIQLAAIQAKPIPAYNKGTLSVAGVDTGKDSVLAMLRPNEAVIPVDMKQAYLPTLQAMFEGSVKPSELNAMVSERRTGKTRGGNDNSDLIRAIKSKSSTSIRNAEELARLIGKEIANSYNPRYS